MTTDEVASRFLQTAVIVDDEAFSEVRPTDEEFIATLGDEMSSVDEEVKEPVLAGDPDDDFLGLDVRSIVSGFADHGIVCAAIAPTGTDEAEALRVRRVAARSDIVILDWRIVNSNGRSSTSLDFLEDITRDDTAHGGRLRLICIYTGERETNMILDQVQERLSQGAKRVDRDTDQLTRGALRVLVLSKPSDMPLGRGTVSEADLASVVIEQFASFASVGLLPRLALGALASLRENAHRLLARFDARHDVPFLSHRAITTIVDANEFAQDLLAEEIASVVRSEDVALAIGDGPVEKRVADLLSGLDEPRAIRKSSGAKVKNLTLDAAGALLTKGSDADGFFEIASGNTLAVHEYPSVSSLALGKTVEDSYLMAKNADLEFSVLSSLVRDYRFDGEKLSPPGLFVGAVLRKRSSGEYLLCLQPLCDAVRLSTTEPTPFALLPLQVAKAKVDIVVADGDKFVLLSSQSTTFSDVRIVDFLAAVSGSVLAQWESGRWTFRAIKRRTPYDWVGHVRPAKAQRIVSEVATRASRIGISEYEYLRRGDMP